MDQKWILAVEKAAYLVENGYVTNVTVPELAQRIYERTMKNAEQNSLRPKTNSEKDADKEVPS